MFLFTHILIAITSVAFTSVLLFLPSQVKLYISYALVVATLATGIYLTIINPASMLRTCTTGLVYVVIVTAGIAVARKRLSTARQLAEETAS